MIHPATKVGVVSDAIGIGVFATEEIPRGTIMVVRDRFDLSFTAEAFAELDPLWREGMDTYMYHDKHGARVLSWDHARYMNHSCHSNTMMTDYGLEIAVRDIAAGEEVTAEYGLLNIQEPYALLCDCLSCRRHLALDDIARHADAWDARILASLLQVFDVEQPLYGLLSLEQQAELRQTCEDPARYRSVRGLSWCADT
jgi:hypothetical protein